jgi:HSP20 family protein
MALFGTPRGSRRAGFGRRPASTESRDSDFELYEEDAEYVLSLELPGFETDDIALTWDDGVLNVAADREDDKRGERTYHRRFRLPKRIDDEDIDARYENGILEVRLPKRTAPDMQGDPIEVSD